MRLFKQHEEPNNLEVLSHQAGPHAVHTITQAFIATKYKLTQLFFALLAFRSVPPRNGKV